MGEVPKPIIPDHEVLRPIGRGAYGEIWLARSLTGATRAVKVISRRTFTSERSFQREFDGMSSFEPISRTHEGFVDILHVGRGDGFFYYIMELADDVETGAAIEVESYRPRTLKSILESRGRLPAGECLDLGLALAAALQALHDRGLTHRDIKPSNIIFVHGVPKLADIGLVAVSGQRSFVGTEGYVPPEGPGTPQADIFSLGKVLYEIAMGKDRLDFPEVPTQLEGMSDQDHVLGLNDILLKACAGKLKHRYSTAAEMRADLARLRSGQKRARLAPLLGAAALLVAAAAGVFAYSQSTRPVPRPAPHAPAGLAVTTDPPGAMVLLDGRVKRSPATYEGLLPGSHQLRVVLQGYEPVEKILQLEPGSHLSVPAMKLVRRLGQLRITSEPEGADYILRQAGEIIRQGKAPALLSDLPEGDYELTGRSGDLTATQSLRVEGNETAAGTLRFLPGNGSVKITSAPGGATVFAGDQEIGVTPLLVEELPPGRVAYELRMPGYKNAPLTGTVESQRCTFLAARLQRNAGPIPGETWTNSLGMVLVPVGAVRFSIWETRVQDYAAFCAATERTPTAPDFEQGPDHPAVVINWHDATAFCQWLTEKERRENLIGENQHYRLPTDLEWSEAAGLPAEGGNTPEARDGKIHGLFPWGNTWPPPASSGNYADQSLKRAKVDTRITGYTDGWPQTAPAGTYSANAAGLHDLGGNVWEWCLEGYKGENSPRDWGVLRGGSWANSKRSELESSYRNVVDRSDREVIYGFRCVLAERGEEK